MIKLYSGSGSQEIDLLEEALAPDVWQRLKAVAEGYLERRGHFEAAELLRAHPFVLHHGTNSFADEFNVLYMRAPLKSYVELAEMAEGLGIRDSVRAIVEAVAEVGFSVRFVAVELDTATGPLPVGTPTLTVSSDVVERALRDAEHLIASQGATSGVDRVHTAFHGYLRAILDKEGIAYPGAASVMELFKLLRERHPAFSQSGVRQAEVDKVLRAFATVIDALNTVRNQASVAHANSALLAEAEAMLMINGVRSLLHYLNAKTQ